MDSTEIAPSPGQVSDLGVSHRLGGKSCLKDTGERKSRCNHRSLAKTKHDLRLVLADPSDRGYH